VIPYGKKKLASGEEVDFEKVFLDVVVPACFRLPNWNIVVERAKDDPTSGIVSERFITDILNADLCITDITGANPNVFYELGLRHAFADKTTLLIGGPNTSLPFDISGISCLWYDLRTEQARASAIETISKAIDKALAEAKTDSPVYKFHPHLRLALPTSPCKTREEVLFHVEGRNPTRQIGIVTGALDEVSGIDVWVNSENTEMEMARPMARSISSVIRYWGAKRHNGHIKNDLIQNFLKKKLGSKRAVPPATVLDTPPGELSTKGVRQLLHVATAAGEPGRGYRAISDLGQCVKNCLQRTLELNLRQPATPLRSILFPIFGTGEGGRSLEEVFPEYLDICIAHMRSGKDQALQKILFLAFTEYERDFVFKTLAFRDDLRFQSEETLEPDSTSARTTESGATFANYVEGLRNRATIARRKGDLGEELQHLNSALETIETNNWRKWFEMGFESSATLVSIVESVSDVYARVGGVYRRLGQLEDAIRILRIGADIEASDDRFRRYTYNSVNRIVLELLAGALSSATQRHDELRALDKRLHSLVSNERKSDTWAWADLAVINILLGEFEASITQIEQSLSLSPNTWLSLRDTLSALAAARVSTEPPPVGAPSISGLQDILSSFDTRFARPN
jgi:tetratricopeptide (TPR) repeat protein